MTATRIGLIGIACVLVVVSAQAHAEATVLFLQGDVRDDGVPVVQGQRVLPGTTLTTGPGARAYLQFSDHQKVVLDERAALRIAAFHYGAGEPRSDRATFDLRRGAARFISGAIGARNPGAVAVRTPQATFQVRGTDFMVALPNWAYVKVLKGAVSVINSVGSVIVGENTTVLVASDATIARPIFTAALPPAASGPFSNLAVAPTAWAVAQSAASGAEGAATGAVPAPRIDVRAAAELGIYAALIAAALSSSSATTHH